MTHPPLTDAERARMADDWSDAAVERWAREMVERHGEDVALSHAAKYREACYPGTPGEAFWSRVRVMILAPPKSSEPRHEGVALTTGVGACVQPSTRGADVSPYRLASSASERSWEGAVGNAGSAVGLRAAVCRPPSTDSADVAPSPIEVEPASSARRGAVWFTDRGLAVEPLPPKPIAPAAEPEQGRLF